MTVTVSRHPRWLSNAWLVEPEAAEEAFLVDAGAPPEPLLARLADSGRRLAAVLVTHFHPDHCAHAAAWAERCGCPVYAHALEADRVPGCDRRLVGGEDLDLGGVAVRVLHVPGHTVGQLAFSVAGVGVFTGDTLFRGSVGGTRGPGHGRFEDLRRSVLDVLLALPEETPVLPGHMEPTTVGRERRENPFVRAWRGEAAVGAEPCRALGRPATLLLEARDYDGGTKAWVRWEDGSEDVVPGSRVERP